MENFEAHITVVGGRENEEILKRRVAELGYRMHVFKLIGQTETQAMATSTYRGEEERALEMMKTVAEELTRSGLDVVRRKLEIDAHLFEEQRLLDHSQYFEAHFKVPMGAETATTGALYLSRNMMRPDTNPTATVRMHEGSMGEFRQRVCRCANQYAGFRLVYEMVTYDDNPALDGEWGQ